MESILIKCPQARFFAASMLPLLTASVLQPLKLLVIMLHFAAWRTPGSQTRLEAVNF
jgi:hypothetical protein